MTLIHVDGATRASMLTSSGKIVIDPPRLFHAVPAPYISRRSGKQDGDATAKILSRHRAGSKSSSVTKDVPGGDTGDSAIDSNLFTLSPF